MARSSTPPCRKLTAAESERLHKPRMRKVQSRALSALGYDGRTRRLFVNFQGEEPTYVYLAVPAAAWRELREAGSRGAFVNTAVKPGRECWQLSERLRASST